MEPGENLPIDVVNEGEPRPLDNTTEAEGKATHYPVPQRSDGTGLIDIPEVPEGVSETLSGPLNFMSPDEKAFYETFAAWMNTYGTGGSKEATAMRDAIKGLVSQCSPKDGLKTPEK